MASLHASREAAGLAARVARLCHAFEVVQHTRMQGVPLLNPALRVEAVGFAAVEGEGAALGVLVTPWFMNLVWLPLHADAAQALAVGVAAGTAAGELWPPGQARLREVGGERFEFIGADEETIGPYALCSLFSPMFEFQTQAVARATAEAVLAALRPAPAAGPGAPSAASAPARRSFLFGRPVQRASA